MIHAPSVPLPASHGFALLSPARPPKLDHARIFTLSSTIAFNLLIFGLLMLPMSIPLPTPQITPSRTPILREIIRKPQVVEVEITRTPPKPDSRIAPRTPAPVTHAQNDTPVLVDSALAQPTESSTELANNTSIGTAEGTGPDIGAPVPMQLAYRSAPPPIYPRNALRRQWSGVVMLQVLVGIDGHPVSVDIQRSSGHRELDDAAREQVLKHWTFQPATVDGHPVQALGLIPIEFNLR